jgi:G:T-mismatch repair DNA endonuclease (very short patch repair protein)
MLYDESRDERPVTTMGARGWGVQLRWSWECDVAIMKKAVLLYSGSEYFIFICSENFNVTVREQSSNCCV